MHIYTVEKKRGGKPRFRLLKECDLPVEFRKYSINFSFDQKNNEILIFGNLDGLISYNYMNLKFQQFYRFGNQWERQPDFVVFDEDQNCAIVASTDDVLWIGIKDKLEIDIDSRF